MKNDDTSNMNMYAIEVIESDNSKTKVHIVAHRSADEAVRWLHENTYASARLLHADVYLITGMTPIRTRSKKVIEYVASPRNPEDIEWKP